jgi:hypothetical protein
MDRAATGRQDTDTARATLDGIASLPIVELT